MSKIPALTPPTTKSNFYKKYLNFNNWDDNLNTKISSFLKTKGVLKQNNITNNLDKVLKEKAAKQLIKKRES